MDDFDVVTGTPPRLKSLKPAAAAPHGDARPDPAPMPKPSPPKKTEQAATR